jgi:hypothetical protein
MSITGSKREYKVFLKSHQDQTEWFDFDATTKISALKPLLSILLNKDNLFSLIVTRIDFIVTYHEQGREFGKIIIGLKSIMQGVS